MYLLSMEAGGANSTEGMENESENGRNTSGGGKEADVFVPDLEIGDLLEATKGDVCGNVLTVYCCWDENGDENSKDEGVIIGGTDFWTDWLKGLFKNNF